MSNELEIKGLHVSVEGKEILKNWIQLTTPKNQHLINGQDPDVIMSRSYYPWRRQGLRKNRPAEKQPLKKGGLSVCPGLQQVQKVGFSPTQA
jgi:hypothetical protein